MSATPLTRAEIDRYVDALDRNEPSQSGWRDAFDHLKPALDDARRIRRRFRLPIFVLLAASIALVFVHRISPGLLNMPGLWPQAFAIACGLLFLVIEGVLRSLFPVLQQEDRVAALLRYYGAKDVPHEEEVY